MARKVTVEIPWSKLKQNVSEVLLKGGYIENYSIEESGGKTLKLNLKYVQKQPVVTDIKRISRPSLRIYVTKNQLPRVLGGMGTAIISTPAGLMTDSQARKKGLGGEVLCKIW